MKEKKCTCEEPSEFDDRHEIDCDLIPDLRGWFWYPHDGEIENGGAWVNPKDLSAVCIEVKGYFIVVAREDDEDDDDEGEPGKTRPLLQVACKASVLNGDDQDQRRLSSPFAGPPPRFVSSPSRPPPRVSSFSNGL